MILDDDIQIQNHFTNEAELLESFRQQRMLRCDLFTKTWRFDFLVHHEPVNDSGLCWTEEFYIFVPNYKNPDDISGEFVFTLNRICEMCLAERVEPLFFISEKNSE